MSEPHTLVELVGVRRMPCGDALHLRGTEVVSRRPRVDVYFNGADGSTLPESWEQLRVVRAEAPGGFAWWIVAAGMDHPVYARSVQIHRDATARMLGVLPAVRPPLRLRLFWWALPRLLRVPLVVRLLKRR